MTRRFLAPVFALVYLWTVVAAQAGFVINSYVSFPPAGGGVSLSIVTTSTYNNGDTAATSHNVTLPGSLVSGNLILLFCGVHNAPTITDPSGWTVNLTKVNTDAYRVYSKISNGAEGATVTIGLSASRAVACAGYQISGNRNGTSSSEIEVSTASDATTANPDPPALTPAWGSAENLWIAASFQSDTNTAITTYPANYTDFSCPGSTCGQLYGSTTAAAGGNGTGAVVAARLLTASSEDPGTFTFSNAKVRSAYTVAVRPQ